MESVLNVEVSCFANYKDPEHPRPVNLLTWLTSTKYRTKVETIREISDKKQRDQIKATLPAITPSGLFTRRQDSALVPDRHSQLICLDIDRTHNTEIANYTDLKAQISRIPNVAYCGLSVSGTGYFVLVLITHPDQHRAQFRALQLIFKERFGIDVDYTPDVSRLRGYSVDTDAYFNHAARPFGGVYTSPVPKPTPQFDRSQTGVLGRQTGHFDGHEEGRLLTRLVSFTQAAGEGQRHITLLRAAILAGGFIAAGRLDQQTAMYALETVASEWPTFIKSQKTIRDGIRYGLTAPLYPDTLYERPARSERVAERRSTTAIVDEQPAQIEPPSPRLPVVPDDTSALKPYDHYPTEWDAISTQHPPTLTTSPRRDEFARLLNVAPANLPLYRLTKP